MESAKKKHNQSEVIDVKPGNKFVLLLRAIFCLKAKNSVSKEAELAQINRLSNNQNG